MPRPRKAILGKLTASQRGAATIIARQVLRGVRIVVEDKRSSKDMGSGLHIGSQFGNI